MANTARGLVILKGDFLRSKEEASLTTPKHLLSEVCETEQIAVLTSIRYRCVKTLREDCSELRLCCTSVPPKDFDSLESFASFLESQLDLPVVAIPVAKAANQTGTMANIWRATAFLRDVADFVLILRVDTLLKRPITVADYLIPGSAVAPFWVHKSKKENWVADAIYCVPRDLFQAFSQALQIASTGGDKLEAISFHKLHLPCGGSQGYGVGVVEDVVANGNSAKDFNAGSGIE